MSVFNLRGGQSFPSTTTPSSTPSTGEFGQKAGMFPNHREYTTPPPEYQPPQVAFQATDPDDVLKQIPDMDLAIADLNSVPLNSPPFRDIPSIFIALLNRPNPKGPEPVWERLLEYFLSRRAHHGHGNLQDLYIFITRVALPNMVIENRKCLLSMYLTRRNLPGAFPLRYDSYNSHISPSLNAPHVPTRPPWANNNLNGTTNPAQINTNRNGTANPDPNATPRPAYKFPKHATRPIFRSLPTPNGQLFLQWLLAPPSTPYPHHPVPAQMMHRPSELDAYLADDEVQVRHMSSNELMAKTARVLRIWWWIVCSTAKLQGHEDSNWDWVDREF